VASGAGLALLGLYIAVTSARWDIYGPAGPGPGFFPLLYAGIMTVLAAALALRGLRTRSVPAAPSEGEPRAAAATWLALAASIPLMAALGFLGGFGLLALFLVRVVFGKSYRTSLIAAVAVTASLYLLFQVALDLELPAGLLGRLLRER
jgi:hypothetical protein